MKMIIAVIRPEKLKSVKDALRDAGINGLTFFPVKGRGSQAGVMFTTRVGTFCVDEIDKTMLYVVAEDEQKALIINVIRESAYTGHIGDGRIFVVPVEESMRISD
jgi:nitrogen regulatory protein P-II 1